MISVEMKVDKRSYCLKIDYDVGDNMAPVSITNDNSLLFYMEIKKDRRINVCALRVVVCRTKMQLIYEEVQNSISADYPQSKPFQLCIYKYHSSTTVPKMKDFATPM